MSDKKMYESPIYGYLDSLYMVNILSLFQPLIGEIRGIGISLALQNGILGHVESGVLWGDDDDWRTF